MTLEQRDEEIAENLSTVEEYQTGEALSGDLRERLEPLVRRVMDKRESQRLEIVAVRHRVQRQVFAVERVSWPRRFANWMPREARPRNETKSLGPATIKSR
ncbi:MAG: hypothetical protein R3C99_21080 [Pirellulaceae bacterium]